MEQSSDRGNTTSTNKGMSWAAAFRGLTDRRTLILFFLGISAGLPILLIFSTLSIWLREAGIGRSDVTFFSWAALGYGFKWVWAPLIDRLPLPYMGRRRSWLLVSLVAMALTDPAISAVPMALAAVALGFASATQDIVIDAYRIEVAEEDNQAILAAAYIAGYRVGMLIAGAGALEIAGFLDGSDGYSYQAWRVTYLIMAGAMVIGVVTTLLAHEPELHAGPTEGEKIYTSGDNARFLLLYVFASIGFIGTYIGVSGLIEGLKAGLDSSLGAVGGFIGNTLHMGVTILGGLLVFWVGIKARVAPPNLVLEGYFNPLLDFMRRYGRLALLILSLIAVYRIADVVMGVIANVFYTDLGFEKQEVGRITKGFGLIMTILGGFLGGLLTLRYGVMKILFLGALLAAATNLLFALLAVIGPDIRYLAMVIAADNLSGGVASAAFVAYLSGLTSIRFTAMQYAIFSSIMLLLPKVIGGYSGSMVDAIGYETFFVTTAIMGIPVLVLVALVARYAPTKLAL